MWNETGKLLWLIVILLPIGVITGLWRSCGTIALFIYCGADSVEYSCGIPLQMMGAGSGAVIYAVFLYVLPICCALTKKKILSKA